MAICFGEKCLLSLMMVSLSKSSADTWLIPEVCLLKLIAMVTWSCAMKVTVKSRSFLQTVRSCYNPLVPPIATLFPVVFFIIVTSFLYLTGRFIMSRCSMGKESFFLTLAARGLVKDNSCILEVLLLMLSITWSSVTVAIKDCKCLHRMEHFCHPLVKKSKHPGVWQFVSMVICW